MKYDRILVPTDLSRYSAQALRVALEHLRPKGRLCLLHVVEPQYAVVGTTEGAYPVYSEAMTRRKEARARRQMEALAKALSPKIELHLVHGSKTAPLVEARSRRFKAQLIVLSTHGRTGLSRILLGSVTQKILSLYRGPVLMLRPGH